MAYAALLTSLYWIGVIFGASATGAGLIAVSQPGRFASWAGFWSTWVETKPTLPVADQRFDIDQVIFRHTRLLGAIVVIAGLFWLYLLAAGV